MTRKLYTPEERRQRHLERARKHSKRSNERKKLKKARARRNDSSEHQQQ